MIVDVPPPFIDHKKRHAETCLECAIYRFLEFHLKSAAKEVVCSIVVMRTVSSVNSEVEEIGDDLIFDSSIHFHANISKYTGCGESIDLIVKRGLYGANQAHESIAVSSIWGSPIEVCPVVMLADTVNV